MGMVGGTAMDLNAVKPLSTAWRGQVGKLFLRYLLAFRRSFEVATAQVAIESNGVSRTGPPQSL